MFDWTGASGEVSDVKRILAANAPLPSPPQKGGEGRKSRGFAAMSQH